MDALALAEANAPVDGDQDDQFEKPAEDRSSNHGENKFQKAISAWRSMYTQFISHLLAADLYQTSISPRSCPSWTQRLQNSLVNRERLSWSARKLLRRPKTLESW